MSTVTEPRAASPQAPVASAAEDALDVRGLSKSFGQRLVLDGIDLRVRRGEVVAILGANGSGKSTALRCVVGLVEPDAGSVRLAGHELTTLSGADLVSARREAAMIFQHIHLVRRLSAFDNVCCGALGHVRASRSLIRTFLPSHVRDQAMSCLQRVGLEDRAGERASRLSGGQQQRVAIARALCQRPSVILADEPVSALDPAAADRVMALLRDLAHEDGLAVTAVLHQPDLARRYADRIVGVREGRISFEEPTERVDPQAVARLYTFDGDA